jgi:COMPASS component SWD3
VLTARFHPNIELDLIASGSTDRTVVIAKWKTGEKLTTIHGAHSGPILCLDWHPIMEGRLVLGSLDNSASVVEVKGLSGPKESISYDVIGQFKLHKKHVVRVKWSPDGKRFATASYDHLLKVLEEKHNEDGALSYVEIKSIDLPEAVESIVWTPDGKWLIASVRLDNYLHYYNTDTWVETKFNMNAVQHDDHVSFTAMDLQLSSDGKHLLVATDKSRMIMFATGTPLQLRNFYDAPNGEWSTPRAAFNQSGTFAYISSEDKSIHVYNTTTGAKVTTLPGHTSNIRDLCAHSVLDVIATSSFDKTIKIWK